MKLPGSNRRKSPSTPGRSVSYSTSPLLASKTPPWRSRFLVALVGLAFAGLLGRALYVQVIGTDFYQKQGEARYAHTLELPASRGRINDRTGQVLAASVAVPSVWAIPKEVDADAGRSAARWPRFWASSRGRARQEAGPRDPLRLAAPSGRRRDRRPASRPSV